MPQIIGLYNEEICIPQIIGLYNERFVCHKLLDCIMRDLYATNYWIV